jgi:hypothetical protein
VAEAEAELMTAVHGCVAYGEESELWAVTAGFLSEGLSLGQQVGYFGWGDGDALRCGLSGLAGADELVERGAARAASLEEYFRRDEPPEPGRLVEFWSAATDAALQAGFAGVRVVADTTPWADLDPARRTVFLRGEQLVDRYRLEQPFTLLCACDASTLAGDALAETACIHPFAEGVLTPFHLHAGEAADLALHGEIDGFAVPLLERVLDSVPLVDPAGGLVIDAAGLVFIEHRSLLALERHAERLGLAAVVLRTTCRTAGELAELLDLRRVRVEGPR